jgi:sortase A
MESFLSLFFSALSLASTQPAPVTKVQEVPSIIQIQPATVKAAELYYPPRNIKINKINLNAPILSVGAADDGTQMVPDDNATTSWWKYGAKPGEKGSAVIAGHYKVEDGTPGVFFRLNEVVVGDVLSVFDEMGIEQKFEVVDRKVFSVAEFPTGEIYENADTRRVNLVTCTGEYLKEKNDYSHRLVLYTKRIDL